MPPEALILRMVVTWTQLSTGCDPVRRSETKAAGVFCDRNTGTGGRNVPPALPVFCHLPPRSGGCSAVLVSRVCQGCGCLGLLPHPLKQL